MANKSRLSEGAVETASGDRFAASVGNGGSTVDHDNSPIITPAKNDGSLTFKQALAKIEQTRRSSCNQRLIRLPLRARPAVAPTQTPSAAGWRTNRPWNSSNSSPRSSPQSGWCTSRCARGRSVRRLPRGFLLATCCFGYPYLHIDGGPLPLTIDRLTIAGLVGIYCVQRVLGRTDPKPMRPIDFLIFAFLGVLAVSTFTHRWRDLPLATAPPAWRLVVGYVFPVIIYWIARQSRLTRRQIGLAQGSLAVFGLYLAVTGLLEASRQWSLVVPHYIADPTVGLHYGRARGPMVQAVSYGLFLTITMLAVFVWQIRRLNRFGRLFWLAGHSSAIKVRWLAPVHAAASGLAPACRYSPCCGSFCAGGFGPWSLAAW